MKIKAAFILFLYGILLNFSVALAQDAYDTPHLNRAILKYFSGQELAEIQAKDSVKFNQIKYYFTQSFIVEKIGCQNCAVDYNFFFNNELFNVVNFEGLREAQNEHSFFFKENKYRVTLLSKQVIEPEMGGLSAEGVIHLKLDRPLPEWVETGDGQFDYENYKKELYRWARDFPKEYRQLTNITGILKIRIGEFLTFLQNKKNKVFSHSDGYMIID